MEILGMTFLNSNLCIYEMEASDGYVTSTLVAECLTWYGNTWLPTNTFTSLTCQHIMLLTKKKNLRKAKIIFLVLHNQVLIETGRKCIDI